MSKSPNITIVSCIVDDWGGSEELWARCITVLKNDGFDNIFVYKNRINYEHPEFIKLRAKNITLEELEPDAPGLKKALKIIKTVYNRVLDKMGVVQYIWYKPVENLYNKLKAARPDLVIISQGINFDGLLFAYQCLKLNIPYIIVSQKAIDFYWPEPQERDFMKQTIINAQKFVFVSQHNKTITEEQFGMRFTNAEVVFNPVKTQLSPIAYPSAAKGYRLACIGRLNVMDKGQDILLKVLAMPKWRDRALTVDFLGYGPDLDGLKELAALLDIKNVSFPGFANDIDKTWANYHALILPSRSEGLPLVIVEAMSVGRIAITTTAGGNAEIIEDGVTGFMGEANLVDFDRVMEEAWQKRDEWESMGVAAAVHVKNTVPASPETVFANMIEDTLKKLSPTA